MARQTAQEARLRAALAKLEPKIRLAFVAAVQAHAGSVDMAALIEALDRGDVYAAAEILEFKQGSFWPLSEEIRAGFMGGGAMVRLDLPKTMAGAFGFNGRHARAEAWVQRHVGTLIQGIEEDTLEMTRNVVRQGVEQGMSSRDVARQITGKKVGARRVGGFLGLTAQQADSIMGGRAKLASGDPALMREYLNLKQRDKRYDAQIKAAIKAGKPITGRQLDRIMEGHKSKALGYRGRLIAKNESHSAMAAGRDEAYRQMLDRPDVETVTKKWVHGLSEDPRLRHVALSGTRINFEEAFDLGGGVFAKHPHDPDIPASEKIGCKCVAVYRVRFRRD